MKYQFGKKTYLILFTLIYNLHVIYGIKFTNISPTDMIRENGYPIEIHVVTTDDGYILTVHRIPSFKGSIPVLLQHGIFESSADWLQSGENKSIAYLLWNKGYDVWLGNARGNTYSKMHTTLPSSDAKFWDFGMDELGIYDIPAVISYIYNTTKKRLFYIGHSMGATSFAITAIEKPEIAKSVRVFFSVAPAVYSRHIKQPILKLAAPFSKQIQAFAKSLNVNELLGRNPIFDLVADYVCPQIIVGDLICRNAIYFINGYSSNQLDTRLTASILSKFPAGTSVKLFIHWLQHMVSNVFQNFDYGYINNLKVYNSSKPPAYNIKNIQVPVAVFYSDIDLISSAEDSTHFYNQVPNKLGQFKVDELNHYDFLCGRNASELVYSHIFKLMNDHLD